MRVCVHACVRVCVQCACVYVHSVCVCVCVCVCIKFKQYTSLHAGGIQNDPKQLFRTQRHYSPS